MSRRLTTSEFIEKAKKVHGNRYKYDLVDYRGGTIKIKILCYTHGVFEQKPNNHTQGQGCLNCCDNNIKRTTEDIIESFKSIHGDKYDYSIVDYVNAKTKVKIICKIHGVFEQLSNCHIGTKGCPQCAIKTKGINKRRKNNQFIRDCKIVHNNKYIYDKTIYTISSNDIVITCPIHRDFKQKAKHHLSGHGCSKCGGNNVRESRLLTTESFIEKANIIHSDKYIYDLVRYIDSHKKVVIKCKKHGVFNQTPNKHLMGRGCPECGKVSVKLNPTGWNITKWDKSSKTSKNFDSFKVYIIRCWNDNEEFYKIGRTFMKTKLRFRSKISMPYNYEVIKEIIFDNAKDAYNKETELKRLNKEHSYLPKISFKGRHECFYKATI